MANSNQRDEKIRYVFDTDGAEKLGAIEKTLGDIVDKSVGTETAFGFVKQHLEELTVAALALSAAIKTVDFGKESVANAAAAEASLSRLRAIAGDAAQQFGDMGDALDKAAQTVNVDSQTATAGLTALLGAGLSLKDGMDALVPTLQLAKIANIDVGTAAETVAKTLASFNLPASDAQRVVDELATASHGAAGGLAAMSEVANRLAPDAKAIGLNLEELVGIVGTLGQRGITGKQAMTGLRDVFHELQDPTSKLRLDLSALGDDSADFGKALTALTSGSPRAQEALLGLNGSARSVINSLGAEGPAAIEKFVAGLNNASGVASKTAATLDNNLSGAWKKFGLSVDDIGEKLAKPVLTPLKDELEKLAGELNKFAESPDFKEIETSVGEMAKNAVKALDELLKNVDWKTFLSDAKAALGGVSDGFASIAEKATTAANVVSGAVKIIEGAYQAAGVAIDGAVHVAAKGVDNLAAAATGGASNLTAFHDTLQDVSDIAGGQMVERIDKLGKIIDGQAESSDKAAAATNRHAQAAKQAGETVADAAPKIDKYQEAEQRLAKAAADADAAQQKAAESTRQAGAAAAAAAEAAKPLADRLRDADEAARKAAAGADALKTAFHTLKVVSQQELEQTALDYATAFAKIDAASDNTARGLADKQAAFIAYAKAALAASANLDEGTKASTQYMLESKASALNLEDALQKLEGTGKSAGDSTAQGADNATEALKREKQAMDDLGDSAKNAGTATQDAKNDLEDYTAQGGNELIAIDDALANTRQGFLNISDAAAKAFDAKLVSDFNLAFDSTGTNIGAVVEALNNAAAQTRAQVASDREQLQGMIDAISSGAEKSTKTIDNMIASIKGGTYQFGILGQQDLAPLLSALEAAKQKTEAADQAAASAAQRFSQLAQSIHDSLLQEQGDQAALEDERHANQLQALKDAAEAGKVSAQQYQQAMADENALHDLKMKHLQEQQQQQQKSSGAAGGGSSSGGGSGSSSGGGSSSSSNASNSGGGAVSGGVPVTVNYPGRTFNFTVIGPAHADSVQEMLEEIARQRTNSINK